MIPATELHSEVRRRLNRFNSDYQKMLVVPAMDSILNEALELLIGNAAMLYEVREDVAINLGPLEVRRKEVSFINQDKKIQAKVPEDHYKITRVVTEARNSYCSDVVPLIARAFQTQKLSEALSSPYWEPSYEWRETIYLRNTDEYIDIYHNNKFEFVKVYIDYIKKHPRIQAPTLTANGSYRNAYNELVTQDQGLLLDSHYQKRQLCDLAALIALRDLSDLPDYQSQLNKIMLSNSYYLGTNQ